MRASYIGSPLIQEHEIDTELVSSVIFRLQNGKAPDVVGLTGEHLIHSHPSISVVLCKLFKIIMQCRYMFQQVSGMVILYLFLNLKKLVASRCPVTISGASLSVL